MIGADGLLNNRINGQSYRNPFGEVNSVSGGNEQSGTNGTLAGDLLSGLKAGDTVQAQIVSVDGEKVVLNVMDRQVEAKINSAMDLVAGRNVTFEVRGNEGSLTLTPLYTNMANESSALKALSMAGLPVNNDSVSMTKQMMQAGLGIDRESLQKTYSEVVSHSEAAVSDVVDLHRLGMEVNDQNLSQISNYKNLSYQISEGMQEIAKNLNDEILGLVDTGSLEKAANLFTTELGLASDLSEQTITDLRQYLEADGITFIENGEVVEENSNLSTGQNILSTDQNMISAERNMISRDPDRVSGEGNLISQESSASITESKVTFVESNYTSLESNMTSVKENREPEQSSNDTMIRQDATPRDEHELGHGRTISTDEISSGTYKDVIIANGKEEATSTAAQRALRLLSSFQLNAENVNSLQDVEKRPLDTLLSKDTLYSLSKEFGGNSMPEIFQNAKQQLEDALSKGDFSKAKHILQNPLLAKAASESLQAQWSVPVKDVANKEEIQHLYQKLSSQLKVISEGLTTNGQENSSTHMGATNMSQNLDFLNQINQMYQYIQLPLRLTNGNEAHGDLYVYTNGKKLTGQDGKVSALLHLDMEHLGPVDVYVAMDTSYADSRVSTQFYVKDDETLDFLNEHMDLLTDRLKQKGYDCSCKLTIKGDKTQEENPGVLAGGGINVLLAQTGKMRVAENSFDVRT